MSILRVRNKTTNQWEEIQAIKGDTGEQGIQGPKGETGSSGADAKINGVNTINIEAGDNITLEQEGNTLTINSTGGGGGTSDYSDLTNKPQINNVTLSGNKTSSDLGLQPAGNYITKAVNDLENYYKKTETFTKQEVNDLISAISTLDLQVVQTLPTQDISTTTIYLVPKTTAETNDVYDEYIYVSNAWEHIGSTEADLTNYVTNTDYASTSRAGLIKAGSSAATDTVSSNGLLYATKLDYSTYNSASDNAFVGKGTLENVIAGKGLVSNTDFANSATGGVIKTSSTTGTGVSGAGVLYASNSSYSTYNSASDFYFIGKGTLENVITGKGLATKSDIPKVFYGTSSTSAGTASKVVVCEDFAVSDLVEGTRLSVYFTNGNSYNGTATLNVNSTGAKNIYYNGTTTNARYMWTSGETVDFIYNGQQWATTNGGLATTSYYGVTKLYTGAASDSQVLALTPRSLYYLANYSIAPYYSASSTYAVGDKVRYTYYLYECNTAITEPEEWTEAHWTQIDTLQEQIDDKQNTLVSGTNIKTINNTSILGSGNISVPQVTDSYSASTSDSYSCNYVNGVAGKVIYENMQGDDLNLVCSETISNFDYLQFDFFHQDYHSSMTVPIIDNKVQIYSIGIPSGNVTMQLMVQRYTINGNTLQYDIEGMANINNRTISWQSFDTNMTTLKVKRILGIKR